MTHLYLDTDENDEEIVDESSKSKTGQDGDTDGLITYAENLRALATLENTERAILGG